VTVAAALFRSYKGGGRIRHEGRYSKISRGTGVLRADGAVCAGTRGTGNGPGTTHGGGYSGAFCGDISDVHVAHILVSGDAHGGGEGADCAYRADGECTRGTRSAIFGCGHSGPQLGVGGWRPHSSGDDWDDPAQRSCAAANVLYGPLIGDYLPIRRDPHIELVCDSASRELELSSPMCGRRVALVKFDQVQIVGVEVDLRDVQPSGRSGAPKWARS